MATPTIYPGSISLHSQRLLDAPKKAAVLARALADAAGKARAYTDPNLSPEGLVAKRAEMGAQFRQAAANDLTSLQAEISDSRDYLATVAATVRPVVRDDAADLIRSQQKWEQVRMQVDAGATLEQILETADVQTALAIEEFGPAWVASQNVRPRDLGRIALQAMGNTEPDPDTKRSHVKEIVHRRLVQLVEPDVALAMNAAHDTVAYTNAAEVWTAAAQRMIDGHEVNMLDTAIAAQMAAPAPTPEAAPAAA